MAEDNSGYSPIREWSAADCKRGNSPESRKANPLNAFRRNDGPPRLSEQGRKEWIEEWSTVVPYCHRLEGSGKEEKGYYLVTILPDNKGLVKKLVHKYPMTLFFLLAYIAIVVTVTLMIQLGSQ